MTYNNRLQPNEIKLGTSGNPTSIVSLTYNYGTTNNNGNVESVGYSGGGLSYTQNFDYDQLNRLSTSTENGGVSWSQTNAHDPMATAGLILVAAIRVSTSTLVTIASQAGVMTRQATCSTTAATPTLTMRRTR